MALVLRNTKELIKPENYKAKILLYGMTGEGKTSFLGGAQDILVGACETGEGNGLLTLADRGVNFCELNSYEDFTTFCSGAFTKKCETEGLKVEVEGLDSLSEMAKSFIKDKALSIPRTKGESLKRNMGVPELDDYGVIAELTRRPLRQLLEHDKHLIVTALMKFDKPDEKAGETELLIGPELAGQMFLGSMAMFDIVMCLRSERTSTGRKRYFITDTLGPYIAKCRPNVGKVNLLDIKEPYDIKSGAGTFPKLIEKILTKYEDFYKSQVK